MSYHHQLVVLCVYRGEREKERERGREGGKEGRRDGGREGERERERELDGIKRLNMYIHVHV